MRKILVSLAGMCLLVTGCLSATVARAAAADFPKGKITWLVPSKAGGGYDIYARAVGKKMQELLPNKVDFVYVNQPAGGGVEALMKLYHAKPDGYTMGFVKVPGSVVSEMTLDFAKYKSDEFSYIGNLSSDHDALVVKSDSPVNSVKDLLAKGTVKFATTGVGATSWVNAVVLSKETGLDIRYVHFTNTADAILSIIRGDAEALIVPLPSAQIYAKSGDVKLLAIGAPQRDDNAPGIPTFAESGYPVVDTAWNASRLMACPPGTPAEVMAVLEDAMYKAVTSPDVQESLASAGFFVTGPTRGAEALKMVQDCIATFANYKDELSASIKQ